MHAGVVVVNVCLNLSMVSTVSSFPIDDSDESLSSLQMYEEDEMSLALEEDVTLLMQEE